MPLFKEREMSWHEFEQRCLELVHRCFPDEDFRIAYQREQSYADGQTKRMDISIAEKRQGGCHYVIDCKHFTKADLNQHEIDTTLDYKRRSRASKAILMVSNDSNCPQRFLDAAERQGVLVVTVSTPESYLLRRMRDFLFTIDLS